MTRHLAGANRWTAQRQDAAERSQDVTDGPTENLGVTSTVLCVVTKQARERHGAESKIWNTTPSSVTDGFPTNHHLHKSRY